MRKIKYNSEFLPRLISRVTAHGRGTKTQVVNAMNLASEKERATLTSLSRWLSGEKPIPVNRIINLVNQMEGVSLSDFFIYEDDGTGVEVDIKERRKRQRPGNDDDTRLTDIRQKMLELRIEHLQEIDALKVESQRREDAVREDMRERQRIMQQTIDIQRDEIERLRDSHPEKKKDQSFIGIVSEPIEPG